MKKFTDIKPQHRSPSPEISPISQDKQIYIKRNLANQLDYCETVRKAVLDWLLSFPGGITKKDFQLQLVKLDKDPEKAISQLQRSKGYRSIRQVEREKPPKLEVPVIDALAQDNLIAIEGAKGRKAILDFLQDLPPSGVYILDVPELLLEYTDLHHKGASAQMIEQSNKASILVITGLEKPVGLPFHIREVLTQLAQVRSRYPDKFTLSTYNYTHTWFIPEYATYFKHYSI